PGILLFEERVFAKVPELKTTRNVSRVTLGERLHAKATTLRDVAIGPTSRDTSVLLAQAPPAEMLPGVEGVAAIAVLKWRRGIVGVAGMGVLKGGRVHFNFIERTLSWE